MQQPLQITFRGIGQSDAIERRIREKATELERFADMITSCHVTVEATHQQHHKGNMYAVRLDIHVPGKHLVAGKERGKNHAHEDVYVALRDSFSAAARQLEDYTRQRRGQVKQHDVPPHGVVSRIYGHEGYGFAQIDGGPEVYFHENSVTDGAFSALQRGDEVRVVIAEGEGEKGPQASTVTPVGKHHLVGEAKAVV